MSTAPLALASKRATHWTLVNASFRHPGAQAYFAIGRWGQPPYDLAMRKLSAAGFAGLFALVALAPACSREPSGAVGAVASTGPLAAGAPAPDVSFPLANGERLQLASLRGKPVVVYFYPKDDTPGCTVEAQEIRDLHDQLKQSGAVVIGVSADPADSHRAFAEKHALPFLLASDEQGELAKAFGVPLKNGRATRVSFVVGADGRIKRTFPQVTPKGHAAELLAAISS